MRIIDADKLKERIANTADLGGWIGDTIAQIKQLAIKYIDSVPSVDMPTWTPCSERLPEQEEKSYWVCTEDGYQYQCRWTNIDHFWTYLTTEWHWHIADVPQYSKVVAWMPLPKPWEGESDE